MFKKTINYFDKLEDRTRGRLSKFPIIYTFIGGVAIVLFWRAVWNTADMLQAKGGVIGFLFYEPVNMIIVVVILLSTGLFVSYFIGDTILISGLKQQKKIYEKTEKEVKEEEATLGEIKAALSEIKKEVDEIKDTVEHDHVATVQDSGKN
ncbi:MAG: hypothetical protein QG640_410 [Patescibacteria group bacterium]|nr:hypothetical protein [Patescibacteria group bacterium]